MGINDGFQENWVDFFKKYFVKLTVNMRQIFLREEFQIIDVEITPHQEGEFNSHFPFSHIWGWARLSD